MLVVLDWAQVERVNKVVFVIIAIACHSSLVHITHPVRTARIFPAKWILSSPDLSPNSCACASTFRGTVASPKLSSAATLSSIDKLGRKNNETIIINSVFALVYKFGVNTLWFRFNAKMRLTRCDRVVMKTSNVEFAVQQSIFQVDNASSHEAVVSALRHLTAYAVIAEDPDVINCLKSVGWQTSLKRYLINKNKILSGLAITSVFIVKPTQCCLTHCIKGV